MNTKSGDSFLDAFSISSSTEDDSSSISHGTFHRWIGITILILSVFSILQLLLVVCVLYMFCKQRLYRVPSSASSGRKVSDACATGGSGGSGNGGVGGIEIDTTIENLDDVKKEDLFKLESSGFKLTSGNNNRERLFMRTQDARKPKFIPRRPVEFLRESPVSLRNYHL